MVGVQGGGLGTGAEEGSWGGVGGVRVGNWCREGS